MMKKIKPSWLFNRSVAMFLIGLFGLIIIAFLVNMLGIHVTGTVDNWQRYLSQNAPYFLMWRLALYSLIVAGWLWVKQRIVAREYSKDEQSNTALKQRVLRIEIATVVAFLALETSNWLGR